MELSTRYEPEAHEGPIYAAWEKSGGFQPRAGAGETFTIMIPPPNVTGVLHMGHALNNTIQDVVIRHRRMQGFRALWVPGTDHAGIATQAVVEKRLFTEGKTREEMGREAFLKEVWDWCDTHGGKILEQLRRLGASCDWSRQRFTFEEHMSRAVREAFVRLWEKDLVYRGARMVNWDCKLQTAVSDDEIEYVQQKSKLWHLRYPLKDDPARHVVVATTRPESMFGDTGVAVHPDDERYRDLVGKLLVLPFLGREIPIVADESVDPKYGTGAVKVTPGHDPADYERGKRHNLPVLNVLTKDGSLNDEAGPFAGQSREAARKGVVKQLDDLGLLDKVETIEHNVPVSDRSKTAIEPLVSEQWFVKMGPLAEPAIAAVKTGKLRFTPERWSKVYLDWLENVHDWCISRQLWWGHRIPVWYDEDGVPIASCDDLEVGAPHPKTGKPIVGQDEDVLDTWASSWLWPFATLGWPDRTDDLATFYPTQFLATAREIIYLWVARMVMAGYEFLDHLPVEQRLPFEVCHINATVMDAKGRRMSKSAGNGIDPIEMIEKYGADAVRVSLVLLTKEGQDTKLAPDRFEQGWRFGNKVWNAARFVLQNLAPQDGSGRERGPGTSAAAARLEDRWILSRLASVRDEVTRALDEYRLNDAATTLYRFVWNDFCDWYVELAKPRMAEEGESGAAARGTLARVLADSLALLHPFAPFVTEVLWKALHETLGTKDVPMLMNATWPDGAGVETDADAEREMGVIQDLVGAVRSVRALTSIGERKALKAVLACENADVRRVLEEHGGSARALAHLAEYEVVERAERPGRSAVGLAGDLQVFVVLGEDVDFKALSEVLARRADKVRSGLAGIDKKLENKGFLDRADPDVVAGERERRENLAAELALLEKNLDGLEQGSAAGS